MSDINIIPKLADELLPYQIEIRRHLHRHPEPSFEEFATTRLLKTELKREKIKLENIPSKTGAVGIINPHHKKAIMVRSDIDALPILEKTGVPFKSQNPGVMHACGHDVHMAVVLGTALILNRLREQLDCAVKFIFQHAEENPPGGAVEMIRSGVMNNPSVKLVFGLHVDPMVPTGKIGLRDGSTMASVIDFDIVINGKGGHAARPHDAVDSIAVAAEVIESLQKIVSRELRPLESGLISIGTIDGGTARNVIAENVRLRGTARTLSPKNVRILPRLIKRTLDGICRARGAKYTLDILSGYPVLSNHSRVNDIFRECQTELFGKNTLVETPTTLGGEDFAYYVQKTPGAMFRLGVRNDKIGANKSWHAGDFMVDEKAIFYGTCLLCAAVLKGSENI